MDGVFLSDLLPQLLGNVRADRRQHVQVDIDGLFPFGSTGRAGIPGLVHFIQQFHQAGDDRVELELLEITRDPLQGLVDLAAQDL